MTNKILWIRELSCGHKRATNIAFISKIYAEPKIGDNAYCRECCKKVEIIDIYEADKGEKEELEELMKEKMKKQEYNLEKRMNYFFMNFFKWIMVFFIVIGILQIAFLIKLIIDAL